MGANSPMGYQPYPPGFKTWRGQRRRTCYKSANVFTFRNWGRNSPGRQTVSAPSALANAPTENSRLPIWSITRSKALRAWLPHYDPEKSFQAIHLTRGVVALYPLSRLLTHLPRQLLVAQYCLDSHRHRGWVVPGRQIPRFPVYQPLVDAPLHRTPPPAAHSASPPDPPVRTAPAITSSSRTRCSPGNTH